MQSLSKTRVTLLGSTGSIGQSTLEVVDCLPDRFEIVGLSAHTQIDLLVEQARKYRPRWIVCTDPAQRQAISAAELPSETELLLGADNLCHIAADDQVDLVVAAIVGRAGLESTWAAIESGKRVALANKETLVVAGSLARAALDKSGATLLPVDSEHSAIFQAAISGKKQEIQRIVLTASGGPFRKSSLADLQNVSVQQALSHPTWEMGRKISIDSATMMNKALEIIEARWLFDIDARKIDVVIHPQSIVHSLVEYVDGSVMAQLSPPDMRLPIQYAMTFPDRVAGPARRLDIRKAWQLEFEPPDHERFPAIGLGLDVAQQGGTCGAVVNAVNEEAVQAFLDGKLKFVQIVTACRNILEHHHFDPHPTLEALIAQDRWARQEFNKWI
jgi:1-deoxy-D-xylulose-5-phosphate reductoisomerase